MKTNGAKIFLKLHGSENAILTGGNPFVAVLRNYLKSRVDGFGVLSLEEKSNFTRAGFAAEKFYQVKNAVTIAADAPPDLAHGRRKKPETFRLLFVSRFITTKGLLETIRACAILRRA